jgi:hypothetical protein
MELVNLKEGIGGAIRIAITLLTPFLYERRARWGATDVEINRSLPGDELAQHNKWGYTHAITIRASAAEIWPWLVQIGQGRGGFYSYEFLENLIGCNIHNADRIIPEFQHLEVGDEIRHHPKFHPYKVVEVKPEKVIVLHDGVTIKPEIADGNNDLIAGKYINAIYIWFLSELGNGHTRLIARGRYDYRGVKNILTSNRFLLEPIAFTTSRKMLLGIKERAEASVKQAKK